MRMETAPNRCDETISAVHYGPFAMLTTLRGRRLRPHDDVNHQGRVSGGYELDRRERAVTTVLFSPDRYPVVANRRMAFW
jgi:hypothetical protein